MRDLLTVADKLAHCEHPTTSVLYGESKKLLRQCTSCYATQILTQGSRVLEGEVAEHLARDGAGDGLRVLTLERGAWTRAPLVDELAKQLARRDAAHATLLAKALTQMHGRGSSGDDKVLEEQLAASEAVMAAMLPEGTPRLPSLKCIDCGATCERTCLECGCTDSAACDGGCSWISEDDDLCSACVDAVVEAMGGLVR